MKITSIDVFLVTIGQPSVPGSPWNPVVVAGVCTLRTEAKVSPTPIILQTGGITNKVYPFISEKIMRNVKKILSSLLLSVMCYTIS